MSRLSTVVLAAGLSLAAAGPCDIYKSANTPCVAAHSTTRALYNAYNGNLYQVMRSSDNTTTNITPLSAGGTANAAAQDSFCSKTTCYISIIYDQTGNKNHLTRAPPGGETGGPAAGGYDNLAVANAAPITLNGKKAYGVYSPGKVGYRIDETTGVAKGNAPEGLYAVLDGTHYNNGCCFDYGNAETDNHDDGAGTMESIYFGTFVDGVNPQYTSGSGPFIKADLENGVYPSLNKSSPSPSMNQRFVHASIKGSATDFALAGGDATTGSLTQYYSGPRPSGYPNNKQGSIILGIGGDNSDSGVGTFYEGVMTSGYPTFGTDQAVQANIVAAKYAA